MTTTGRASSSETRAGLDSPATDEVPADADAVSSNGDAVAAGIQLAVVDAVTPSLTKLSMTLRTRKATDRQRQKASSA